MDQFLSDLRYGLRLMVKNPAYTAIAVIALALGIGANTAIFSVVHAVLLRALPYPNGDRLVQVWGSNPSRGVPFHNVAYSDAAEWRRQSRSLELVSACAQAAANLTGQGDPERVNLWRVNAGYFPLLGATFLQGRGFLASEDQPGAPPVAVLSAALWKKQFASDAKVIGRSIQLDGKPYTVVGVLPTEFQLIGRQTDLYVPLAQSESRNPNGAEVNVSVFARLKPGMTIPTAQTEMNTIGTRLAAQFPLTIGRNPVVWGLRDFVVRNLRLSLWVLLGAVGFVLLIACANVANLLLARIGVRRGEMAIRTALGASRGRLVRQMLTESALMALAGGTLGVLLAYWGVEAFVRLNPTAHPMLREASIDLPVLGFTLSVSLLTGLVFGLAPALGYTRQGALLTALTEGGRRAVGGVGRQRARALIVISEVALSVVLLIGAGLLMRSFLRLRGVNPGFAPGEVLTAAVNLPAAKYSKPAQRITFFEQLSQRLESLPAVRAVGWSSALPLLPFNAGTAFFVEGRSAPPPDQAPLVWFRVSDGGYFRAMEIPLIKGRLFDERDDATMPPVAIINQTLARRFWPGEDPVGKRFTTTYPQSGRPITWMTVVGIVGDLRHQGLGVEPDAELFWPYRQLGPANLSLVVRTRTDATQFSSELQRLCRTVDPDQPVSQVRSMEQVLDDSIAPQRLSTWLLGVFSAVALLLAAVGIYGVISFFVASRTHEIGVRMALGAEPQRMRNLVVKHLLGLAFVGVVLGLAAAAALTRVMQGMLFGVTAVDPLVYAVVCVLLLGVALVASYLPAHRASRVDPSIALRHD